VPIRKRHVLTVLVVALVVVAGCGGSGTQGETSADGQSGNQGADSDWCPAGQSTQFANPQTGEQVSLVFQGTVTYEGRQVCKATWETNDPEGEIARIVMYYTEERSYQKVVYYDGDGNVVLEQEQSADG